MQTSVPDLVDMSDETESTLDAYGAGSRQPGTFENANLRDSELCLASAKKAAGRFCGPHGVRLAVGGCESWRKT
jgi:hypothetical protein